jgi:hypothetical protein
MRGKHCAGLGLLLMPAMLFAAGASVAADKPTPPISKLSTTIIVLDASRSMSAKIDNGTKLAVAQSALGEAIASYQDRLSFGLVAFGHRQVSNCADTQTLAKAGELTSSSQAKLLASLKSKGQAPIAAALSEAAKEASPEAPKLDIVLIAGAVDSCKADYCGTAELLKTKAPALRIHVLAFDAKAGEDLKPLACIADKTGGRFIAATNADELKQGLAALLDTAASPTAPAAVAAAAPARPAEAAAPGGDVTASLPSQVEPSGAIAGGGDVPLASAAEPAITPPESPTNAPGQTDVQKSASPSPAQAGPPVEAVAPTKAAPAQPSLPVPVTFRALLTETGPKVQAGLTWRVFSTEKAPSGGHKLLSTHHEATPTAALLPGDYLVNAAYGLSNLTREIKVESGRSNEETFILNTGALKLSASLANGEPLPPGAVHFDIMSDDEDQFGNRRTILGNAKTGLAIRLNAGAYHIVSLYGDANATVRADVTVEPGKLTQATVKHAAAPVTFKLVQEPGGEALADTQWSVLTASGDVVKVSTGAIPTHILAAGTYAVVASHSGLSYTSKFAVETGQAKQIEVLVEAGPTSAEALRAITNPEPPPEATDTAMPDQASPETGAAFDGAPTPSAPSGLLLNPGALLRPQIR